MSTPTPPDLRRPGPAPQPFGPTLPRRWWAWPAAIVTGCAIAFAAFLASLAGEALPYTQDLTPNCASLGPPHPGASAPPSLPALPGQTVLATAQGFDLGPSFTAPRPNGTTYVFTAVPETRLEIVQAQVTQALQRTGHRVTLDEQAPPAPDPPRGYALLERRTVLSFTGHSQGTVAISGRCATEASLDYIIRA